MDDPDSLFREDHQAKGKDLESKCHPKVTDLAGGGITAAKSFDLM